MIEAGEPPFPTVHRVGIGPRAAVDVRCLRTTAGALAAIVAQGTGTGCKCTPLSARRTCGAL